MLTQDPTRLSDGELVVRAHGGDDQALVELLGRYRPMVRSRSRRYYLQGADRSDVVQEGMIGLYKAVRDFTPELGHEFGAFAQRCITRQLISAVRGAQRHKHQPLNRSVPLDGGGGDGAGGADRSWVAAVDADPAVQVLARIQADALAVWCERYLSAVEHHVLRAQLAGETYAAISRQTGLSPKGVDNAVQRIRRKLHRHLARAEALLAA